MSHNDVLKNNHVRNITVLKKSATQIKIHTW